VIEVVSSMEVRSRSFLRRPVLNELSRSSRSSRSSSDQSADFILIDDELLFNNDRNIINNQSSNTSRSLPEEEIIRTRGRKKTKCMSPFLRDLSPNTLVTIKSPIKNSKNEELLKFLRSPTPRKCKLKDDTSTPVEVKRARKCLIVDLEVLNNGKSTPTQATSTPTSNNKKKPAPKKTPTSNNKSTRKKFFNLRRSTNISTSKS